MGLDKQGRAALDAQVAALAWDETSRAWGSEQRRQVAAWCDASGLVDQTVGKLFPNPQQRERMIEYTRVRVIEKILGIALESRAAYWNPDNLWDPTLGKSFCAWVRGLSRQIALANGARQLHPRAVDTSTLDEEDGYNEAFDAAASVNVTASVADRLFAINPHLNVPRPMDETRERILTRFQELHDRQTPDPDRQIIHMLQSSGWWDRSLDRLDDADALSLILTPLEETKCDLPALLLPDDYRTAARLFALTQVKHKRHCDRARLLEEVTTLAVEHHVREWSVWLRLGTAVARLAA